MSLFSIGRDGDRASSRRKIVPGEVRYMAGLQRIEYVLALPESNDIVLAGPAEGWKIDPLGNVVGATTGRAVLNDGRPDRRIEDVLQSWVPRPPVRSIRRPRDFSDSKPSPGNSARSAIRKRRAGELKKPSARSRLRCRESMK